jgi:hypothetical protein
LIGELKQRLAERMLSVEMDVYLSACRRVNPTARTPHALHEFPNEQVQQP